MSGATAASWVSFLGRFHVSTFLVLLAGVARRAPCGRAGHVEDDLGGLGVYLFSDGGESAEELVGDVGEDGARRVEICPGEEEEQAREEVIDLGAEVNRRG